MTITNIAYTAFILLSIAVITYVIIYGVLYVKKTPAGVVNYKSPLYGDENAICAIEEVECSGADASGNSECNDKCSESDVKCIKTSDLNAPKYSCATVPPDVKCAIDKGGVLALTAVGLNQSMNWECKCAWSDYYEGLACDTLVPGICETDAGNGFVWDSNNGTPEEAGTCTCDSGYITGCTYDGDLPRCVKASEFSNYSDTLYKSMKGVCGKPRRLKSRSFRGGTTFIQKVEYNSRGVLVSIIVVSLLLWIALRRGSAT